MREARGMLVGRCDDPRCKALHIDLVDEDNEVFASAVVPACDIPKLTQCLRNYAYEIATETETLQ